MYVVQETRLYPGEVLESILVLGLGWCEKVRVWKS